MPRRNFLRPIHTNKHENTWSNLGQNASTVQEIVIASGVDQANKDSATEVEIGSHVKSIYFEFHFSPAQTGNVNVIHWTIRKLPFATTATIPSLYFQVDRRFIFKRGMEMLPTNVSTVFKRIFVVKIPRGASRMGDGDKLVLQYIASSTQTINACGIAIYKEIS